MKILGGILICVMLWGSTAQAWYRWEDEEIVNAIYKAEGGTKTRHPYGILTKYKTTTPRQACFNTVRNQRKRHKAHRCGKVFLQCLADRYCPIGAKNDPRGLNKYWLRNVRYFLIKDSKVKGD